MTSFSLLEEDVFHFKYNPPMSLTTDWEHIYQATAPTQVGWYQDIRSNPYSLSCIPVFLKQEAVKPGGHVIMATFASDGPERCSGLQVSHYEPESLRQEFGDSFALLDSTKEVHHTPFGTNQEFIYCYCRKA